MVFDWDKAAKIIKETNPKYASAGLRDDWSNTGGTIWEEGKPVFSNYTFLASWWADPMLVTSERGYECYVPHGSTEWSAETKWPESALKILGLDPEDFVDQREE